MPKSRTVTPKPRNSAKAVQPPRPTLAARADRYVLYQQAVQAPEAEVRFIHRAYRRVRGRAPSSLREDFCGTGYLSTAWAKSHRGRTAIGIDISTEPLDWGRANVLAVESLSVQARVQLVEADVRHADVPPVDVIGAFNYSYCCFKDRATLLGYFRAARAGLAKDGIFICDLFGGTEAIATQAEERKCKGFTYVWDQAEYNPITHESLNHIHFLFRDGSSLLEAFTYDWRLWSIPEVRELLLEAGFSATAVWWDPIDADDYRKSECEEQQATWLVYIVAAL
ncbi:MAG: class I SAM-dependent methyltransferase [Myxococcales bacterium]|nr:class I SAM-dependent methyltransferase [Myxococcales bacterium]